ncbi:hypothetical protein MXD62_31790 [Frankia sp. Mgl5]|uniref:hypothetical protein n=1 Tax=Frankia sp. Mgl5 TaxID=2933793 RepID=UPI00200BD1C0|nr:hypothetical protein [Frankia sp. Mgl5]MCK9931670.1 hypothetical protein [Frankia sp. Mgl5]
MAGLTGVTRTRSERGFGRRPVLRAAVFGISVVLVGLAVTVGYAAWRAHRYDVARGRATVVVEGTVINDRFEKNFEIRVRWTGIDGRTYAQWLEVDTQYHVGEKFAVAYDPTDPSPQGFVAEPGVGHGGDESFLFLVYAGAAAVVVPLWWGTRGLRFSYAARQPDRPMVAHPRVGRYTQRGWINYPSTRLVLYELGSPVPYAWQRVMWHPGIEEIPEKAEVTVRGESSASGLVGALAVDLPGGVRLVPVGRVRRHPPKRIELRPRAGVNAVLGPDGRIVVDRDDPPPRPHPWWRRGPRYLLVGVLLGGVFGFGQGGMATVLPGSVFMTTVVLTCWTLSGGEP